MAARSLAAVALALSWSGAGCGGGGGGDSTRMDVWCAPHEPNTAKACLWQHSDVAVPMACGAGYHEVAGCADTGVVATCTLDQPPRRSILRVYDPGSLGDYESLCASEGGTWRLGG